MAPPPLRAPSPPLGPTRPPLQPLIPPFNRPPQPTPTPIWHFIGGGREGRRAASCTGRRDRTAMSGPERPQVGIWGGAQRGLWGGLGEGRLRAGRAGGVPPRRRGAL